MLNYPSTEPNKIPRDNEKVTDNDTDYQPNNNIHTLNNINNLEFNNLELNNFTYDLTQFEDKFLNTDSDNSNVLNCNIIPIDNHDSDFTYNSTKLNNIFDLNNSEVTIEDNENLNLLLDVQKNDTTKNKYNINNQHVCNIDQEKLSNIDKSSHIKKNISNNQQEVSMYKQENFELQDFDNLFNLSDDSTIENLEFLQNITIAECDKILKTNTINTNNYNSTNINYKEEANIDHDTSSYESTYCHTENIKTKSISFGENLNSSEFVLCLPTTPPVPKVKKDSLQTGTNTLQERQGNAATVNVKIDNIGTNENDNKHGELSSSFLINSVIMSSEMEESTQNKNSEKCNWDNCRLKFDNPKNHYIHIENDHIPKRKSKYSCGWINCGKKFTQRQKILRHLTSHVDYKQFQCKFCRKFFKHIEQLKNHGRIHTGIKRNVCPCCGKNFSSPSALQVHRRMHTGEKPHQCQTCFKKFSDPSNFAKHIRIHSR